jgi:hypothetical protein
MVKVSLLIRCTHAQNLTIKRFMAQRGVARDGTVLAVNQTG